jgi:predicted transcriptional regulator
MKAIAVKQLDERDEEIADALISLGISKNAAIILAYLQDMKSAKSFDVERGANLRQPEVSIAMKQLKEHDWINEREDKKPGKGRPYKIYSLKIGFDKIVAQLEKQQKTAVDEERAKIERLKELGK